VLCPSECVHYTIRRSSKWLSNINIRKNPEEFWTKVNEVLRGTCKQSDSQVERLIASVLNDRYAAMSTDASYKYLDQSLLQYTVTTTK
jgi:uncharacterized membrane-anchored protein YjiN (DUF445 family)